MNVGTGRCVGGFFFKQKTAYEMRISDWSSDVCSSDLRQTRVSTHCNFKNSHTQRTWAEKLSERSSADGIHGTRLEIHEDGTRHVAPSSGFVEVHVDALELEVGVSVVGSSGVAAVLVGDDFPELGTDLVAALSSLDVHDLSHCVA